MSVREQLRELNLESYLTALTWRPLFYISGYSLDDDNYVFDRTRFLSELDILYSYKHTKDPSSEYFCMFGKLIDDNYFTYDYSFRTNMHDIDCSNIEICITKDKGKILDLPDDMISIRPYEKI